MYPTPSAQELAQHKLEFFACWAQRHRGLIIQQSFRLYDRNYFYLHKLYKDGQVLMPEAMYRRRSFCVVSQLLARSRYTAEIGLRCQLNLSRHRREEMRLLNLHLHLYLDSRQLQLCPEDHRWPLDVKGAFWQDHVNRRWLAGHYLHSILRLLVEHRVVLDEV